MKKKQKKIRKAYQVSIEYEGETYEGWEIYPPGVAVVYCHANTPGKAKTTAIRNDPQDIFYGSEFIWLNAIRAPEFDNVAIPNEAEKACDCSLCNSIGILNNV